MTENPQRDAAGRFVNGHTKLGGATKGPRFTTLLLERLEEKGLLVQLLDTWIALCLDDQEFLNGKRPLWAAFKEMLDRVDGRPVEKLELSSMPNVADLVAAAEARAQQRKREREANSANGAANGNQE
jgi:hypothetical protein